MKTFNDYKEEVAEEYGYADWGDLLCADRVGHTAEPLDYYIDEAAELYATEVAKAQREACAQYEGIELIHDIGGYVFIDKDSILSTPLVTDKK